MKYYKLHLIRHGLTEGNLQGLYIGSGSDLPLCAEGRAQLKTLKKDFDYPQVEFAQWMDPTSRTVPEGAEDRQMFFNRTSSMLMKMFEYMLRTHTEEAACVTHGGVIMNMLSQHALPFRKPEEWMTDPGAGYSVRLDAEMWMRDHLAEAYDVVPHGYLDGME